MTGSTRVLVLTDSEETAQLLPSLLAGEEGLEVQCGTAAAGEALKALGQHQPHVVVVADTLEAPAATVAALDAAAPDVPQVVILPDGDAQGAQTCSLAGARATLWKPFNQQTLASAIRHVRSRELRRQEAAAAFAGGAPRQQRPRVIAILGVKGGVGATTLACNAAVALHQLTGRRVALLDADLLSGDVGVHCDLPPRQSILDLLPEVGRLDAETVDSLLVPHPSGVRVLLAPEQLQRAEAVDADDVQRVVIALRPYFDYQIVDTSSRLSPVTLAVLDEADLVVVVVTPELPALRNASRLIHVAAQLGYPPDKLVLVVNRAGSGRQISTAVVEEHFDRPVAVAIPSDGQALIDALNAGQLLVEAHPHRKVAECVRSLACEIAGRSGWNPEALAERSAGAPSRASASQPPAGAGQSLAGRLARVFPFLARGHTTSEPETSGHDRPASGYEPARGGAGATAAPGA